LQPIRESRPHRNGTELVSYLPSAKRSVRRCDNGLRPEALHDLPPPTRKGSSGRWHTRCDTRHIPQGSRATVSLSRPRSGAQQQPNASRQLEPAELRGEDSRAENTGTLQHGAEWTCAFVTTIPRPDCTYVKYWNAANRWLSTTSSCEAVAGASASGRLSYGSATTACLVQGRSAIAARMRERCIVYKQHTVGLASTRILGMLGRCLRTYMHASRN
jgi:hypothetical protein